MLEVEIPGEQPLRLEHLVLDFNGTLARNGILLAGVEERLLALGEILTLHIVTGDTFGTAQAALVALPCRVHVLAPERQGEAKLAYVRDLGCACVVCIGNGNNDRLMLEAAALGIAVIQEEGAARAAITPLMLSARGFSMRSICCSIRGG
jgi:P-type E1-E2 ATPase